MLPWLAAIVIFFGTALCEEWSASDCFDDEFVQEHLADVDYTRVVPKHERQKLTYTTRSGVTAEYPLTFALGAWTQFELTVMMADVLLREVLGIETKFVTTWGSADLQRKVAGCQESNCSVDSERLDPPQAMVGLEAWVQSARENELMREMNDNLGLIGYTAKIGLFMKKELYEEAWRRDRIALDWWRSLQLPGIAAYFDTWSDVTASFEAWGIPPLCKPGNPNFEALQRVVEEPCRDGWWFAPACRANRSTCIPVVLAEYTWNMEPWVKTADQHGYPFAITWISYASYSRVPQFKSKNILFYCWDGDFKCMDVPTKILWFDPVAFGEPGQAARIQLVSTLLKVVWRELKFVHNRIWGLFRMISLTDAMTQEMMRDFTLQSAAASNFTASLRVVCKWLRGNVAQWKPWLPTASDCPAGDHFDESRKECRRCPAGRFTPIHGLRFCLPCAGGTFAESVGARQCWPCEPGRSAPDMASRTCEPCERGRFQDNAAQSSCLACPGGMTTSLGAMSIHACFCPSGSHEIYAPGSSHADGSSYCACPMGYERTVGADGFLSCPACPAGKYEVSSECFSCADLWISEEGSTGCTLDHVAVGMVACFALIAFFATFIGFSAYRRRFRVVDVRLVDDKLVVTTFGSHSMHGRHFRLGKSRGVQLLDTGIEWLNQLEISFTIQSSNPEVIELNFAGVKIFPGLTADSSMGMVVLHSPIFSMKVVFVIPLVMATIVMLSVDVTAKTPGLIAGAIGAALGAVSVEVRRRKHFHVPTPIQKALSHFKDTLLAQNPSPRSCERGPDRAVSVRQLKQLCSFFSSFIHRRNMYYVASNIVNPLTQESRLSYAELVGPARLQYFVSHFWGNIFMHFVQAVEKHAMDQVGVSGNLHMEARYWVCTLSNNQWRVPEEMGAGSWIECSFYKALTSAECAGTCMVLDNMAQPLTRSWCLFEVCQTCLLAERTTTFQGLFLCTPNGVLTSDIRGCYDSAIALARRISTVSVQSATASDPNDKKMIDDMVLQRGGFDEMDRFVRRKMREALAVVKSHIEADFIELSDALVLDSQHQNDGETLRRLSIEETWV